MDGHEPGLGTSWSLGMGTGGEQGEEFSAEEGMRK